MSRRISSVRLDIEANASTSDRKSTRLNSSHSQISYAVFCLKKKNVQVTEHRGSWSGSDGEVGWTAEATRAIAEEHRNIVARVVGNHHVELTVLVQSAQLSGIRRRSRRKICGAAEPGAASARYTQPTHEWTAKSRVERDVNFLSGKIISGRADHSLRAVP